MTVPYAPGDRIILRRDPVEAWTVERCEPHPKGGHTLRCRTGNCTVITYDFEVMLAPAGWQDAPMPPNGVAAAGLDFAAWETKREIDEADPTYQLAMKRWRRERRTWALKHLARVDAAAAAREIAGLTIAEEREAA